MAHPGLRSCHACPGLVCPARLGLLNLRPLPRHPMQRSELEHLIRACSAMTGHTQFVITGSQALLGLDEHVPDELHSSLTADLFCQGDSEATKLITKSLGENTLFDQTFGYCARGVNEEDFILPEGWRERVIPIESSNTAGACGYCLEVHDLAVSRLAAHHDDDFTFLLGLLRYRLIDEGTLEDRLTATELSTSLRAECEGRFARLIRALTL